MSSDNATMNVPVEQSPGGPPGLLSDSSSDSSRGGLFVPVQPVECRYCERPAAEDGLCHTHFCRRQRGAPMDTPIKRSRRKFSDHPVTYDSAHTRCKLLWGNAKHYACIGCGGQAKQWAYDGTDPTELLGQSTGRDHSQRETSMRYSRWPEFYAPMCQKCHAAFDHPGEVGINHEW